MKGVNIVIPCFFLISLCSVAIVNPSIIDLISALKETMITLVDEADEKAILFLLIIRVISLQSQAIKMSILILLAIMPNLSMGLSMKMLLSKFPKESLKVEAPLPILILQKESSNIVPLT